MNEHSRNLFEFVADFSRRPLSPALADAAALRLMDTLGCALYGGGQEWTQNPAQDRIELPGPRDRLRREDYAECGGRCFVQRHGGARF